MLSLKLKKQRKCAVTERQPTYKSKQEITLMLESYLKVMETVKKMAPFSVFLLCCFAVATQGIKYLILMDSRGA